MPRTIIMHIWITVIFSIAFWSAVIAYALTFEQGSDAPTQSIEDYIEKYIDIPAGAIDWKVLGATKEISVKIQKDGYDYAYSKPEFGTQIKALDGQTIKIKGFMFPLDATDAQKLFLFGPFPVSCPFHYHVGPSLVIEVHADKNPVEFSYDPLVLTGKLELVKDDPENSTFYRLHDAQMVKK
jgi:hypothetical protein